MREIEKPNFVRNRKLVKKTIFPVALLIAAILLLSSVVPAAMHNNTPTGTKVKKVVQTNPQLTTKITSAGAPLEKSPSKVMKIENPEPTGRLDLWDNGAVDGVNGLSCGAFSGLNRELTDDFTADATWSVSGGSFRGLTYYGYGPEVISQVDVYFYADIAGVPDTTPMASYMNVPFTGWLTGNYYFTRPEFQIDIGAFGPQTLTPGDYWVEFQPTATDNIFWLTAPGSGSECYLSYPDIGYPKWTPATTAWGVAYNINFKLTGTIAGVEHDVGVNSIISPSSGNGQVFTPKVSVSNNGNYAEEDVPVQMTIGKWIPPAPPTYYMNEQFTTWMPTGWTQPSPANGDWTLSYSSSAGGTSPEAYLSWSYATDPEILQSPSINTNAATTLHLSFRSYVNHYSASYPYNCKVWVQSGSNDWTDMTPWTNPVPSSQGPALYDIDITAKKGVDTQVKFEFTGDEFGLNYWYLDNVVFYAPAGDGYYDNEYDETVYVDIPMGAKLDVTFPTWTPEAYQVEQNEEFDYQVWAETQMVGDEIPEDDAKTKDITLFFPYLHDIGIEQIISPIEDGNAQTLPVEIVIKNYGQYPEHWFNTDIQIGSEIQTPVYTQDFEASNGGYAISGSYYLWQWGYPSYGPGAPHSGSYCWGTSYYGANYVNYANEKLDTVAITVPTNGRLAFWHWYSTESYWDGGNVKISVSPYSTWTVLGSLNDPYDQIISTGNSGIPGEPGFSGSSGGWERIILDLSAYAGQTVKFRFHFGSDSSVSTYPGWYVDDVEVYGVSLDPEYDDELWQNSYLNPGETKTLTFNDWTPEALADGISGDISYIVAAETLLTGDTHGANDNMAEEFTLSYFHDVKVKSITEPSKGGRDVLFSQRQYNPDEAWSFYTSASGGPYLCQDDFYGVTGAITNVEFYGLPLVYSGGWIQGNPAGMQFEIIFYEDAAGVPGTVVATFSNAEPTSTDTGQSYSGYEQYFWSYDLPEAVVLEAGWVSIQSTYCPDGSWLLWAGSPEGNFNALQNGAALGDSLAFTLNGGGGGGGAPPVTVYVAPGSAPVQAIVSNLGTFAENGLTCYAEIDEFITDPEVGTPVYNDDVSGINLDPLGDEQTISFAAYNFATEGVYGLYVSLPLGVDDFPNNNQKAIGIGCDATPPESTHSLNPATPNGLNGWYTSDVTITLSATDEMSGVDVIKYQVDGGSWQNYGAPFKVTTDGQHIVKYYAIDNVGNDEGTNTIPTFKIDKTAPEIAIAYEVTGGNSIQGWDLTFTVTASDPTSGMDRAEFLLNGVLQATVEGAGPEYQWVLQHWFGVITVTIKGTAYNMAGLSASDEIENPTSHAQSQQSSPVVQPRTVKIVMSK